MHNTGCLGLVHWDDPEGWNGEGGGAMTDDELFTAIRQGLNVCEDSVNGEFHHKKLAEYVERAMYVCPTCGLTIFHSEGDITTCQGCGLKIRHLPTKELQAVEGQFPFRFVADWYDYQCKFINKLNLHDYYDTPMYRDTAELWEIFVNKGRIQRNAAAEILLFGNRVSIAGTEYPFEDISTITVLGKNKVNLYIGKKLYQFRGDAHFNGLKYVNIFNHYKNAKKENAYDEFLGL